jgi:methionyl-tRNA synthetase
MLKFVNVKYDSVIPHPQDGRNEFKDDVPYAFAEEDKAFVEDVNALITTFIEAMDHQKIRAGLAAFMALSSRGNVFLQENRLDNALLISNPSRCAEVVLVTVNFIYTLAALVHPFMPSTSDSMLEQLNATPRSIPDSFSIDLFPGHKIGTAYHLFNRIDPAQVPIWRSQYGGEAAAGVAAAPSLLALGQESKAAKKAALKAKQAAKLLETSNIPRTEAQVVLDEQITAQGDIVRRIKVGGGTEGEDVTVELGKLKALKAELESLTKSLAAATL